MEGQAHTVVTGDSSGKWVTLHRRQKIALAPARLRQADHSLNSGTTVGGPTGVAVPIAYYLGRYSSPLQLVKTKPVEQQRHRHSIKTIQNSGTQYVKLKPRMARIFVPNLTTMINLGVASQCVPDQKRKRPYSADPTSPSL